MDALTLITQIGVGVCIYLCSVGISCMLNGMCDVREPESLFDFLTLTFLPYVIWNILFNKNKK